MTEGIEEGSNITAGDPAEETPKNKKKGGKGGGKKKPTPQDLPNWEGPGVALVKIPAITAAAKRYERIKNERCELTRQEVDSKQKLAKLIHDNEETLGKDGDGVIRYRYDDKVVIVEPKGESLKIRDADEPESDED